MPFDLTRGQAAVLLLCMVAIGVHQFLLWDWFIDDAVISFAYARNLADGHGLVATVGGERVEGYSNATWVAVLALARVVGLDIWLTAKVLCMALSAAWAPLAWWLTREALDGRGGPALVAPLVLATNAQVAIWGASGLENALFGVLLLGALARTLVEARSAKGVGAPILWLLLSATRPEAIAYAALGGAAYLALSVRSGHGWRPTARWLAVFWGPWLAYNGLRYAYFAWPLPNTYYAKVGTTGSSPLAWWGPGWGYVRAWAHQLGAGWLLPVFVLGLTGVRGRVGRLGLGALVALAVVLLWPGPDALRVQPWWPALPGGWWWMMVRFAVLGALAGALPLAVVSSEDGQARALCWWVAVAGLGFAVYADGDWMQGFRWMSLIAGPLAVVFACGVVALADAAGPGGVGWGGPAWLVASALTAGSAPANIHYTQWFAAHPEDGPALIRNRIRYMTGWQRRLHLDHVVNLDMDMGAHLWDTTWDQVDVAGLVDVPIAHHRWDDEAFGRSYALIEHQPDFAHLHRFWAEHTRLTGYPEWADFLALPPYPDVHGPHDGVWLHRRHVVSDRWVHPVDRTVDFGGGVTLEGFALAGPEAEPGRTLHLEAAWSALPRPASKDFHVVAFLARPDGRAVHSWDLDLAYGLLPPHRWARGEVVRANHALRVPANLPLGIYDLGFAVFSAHGTVLRVGGVPRQGDRVAPGAEAEGALFVRGEVRFRELVVVSGPGTVEAAAEADRDAAIALSGEGRCDAAEASWRSARLHMPRNEAWHELNAPNVVTPLARCLAETAEGQVERLVRGRRWDPAEPALLAAASDVADARYADGMAARAAGHWAVARAAFEDVLAVAPHRAWARRYAEEARDRLAP
ncbi:MAG: hypothetical protein ACI8PZ_005359 [Myxococcota bacterium]|jgi:hypothetical protein